jgi:hypothetical protein
VTLGPGRAFVYLRVERLPAHWRIDRSALPLAARLHGDVVVHRRIREALQELDALLQGGSVVLVGGRLELELPRSAAENGQLVRAVGLVRDVLEALREEPDWGSVALDPAEATEIRLMALGHVLQGDEALAVYAGALADDEDVVMRWVAHSLTGDPSGLQAWCEEAPSTSSVLALPLLPPAHRGEVVARRLTRGASDGFPFVHDLRERLASDRVPEVEIVRLGEVLRTELERRSDTFGVDLFARMDDAMAVLGPVAEVVAERAWGGLEGWIELLLAAVPQGRGERTEELLGALAGVATVTHVPAIRALQDLPEVPRGTVDQVVRTIQSRVSGPRGGVALAPSVGGEVGLVEDAERPRPRPGARRTE